MQIFNNNKDVFPIYTRALCLTISKEFAQHKSGKIYTTAHQNSEQANRRRELLPIEEQAKQTKIIEAHDQENYKTEVMNNFFTLVNQQINKEFDKKEHLYGRILKTDDAAPAIMEILVLKAASINRIAPLVKTLPWLCTELVDLVNKPQYRKRSDVKVTDPNLALSYIGLDNLKLVMPTFMLKHWLPTSTDPFKLMKRKLWNNSLSIALASQKLAKLYKLDEFTALTAGMMSSLGLLTVTKIFLNTYSELYSKELRKAYESKNKKLHTTLIELEVSPSLLLEHILQHSSKVSAEMVEMMSFERLQITKALFELSNTTNYNDLSSLVQIIVKAKTYVAFRNLAKEKLISSDEAKALLLAGHLSANDIATLKKSDIDHIKLNFS